MDNNRIRRVTIAAVALLTVGLAFALADEHGRSAGQGRGGQPPVKGAEVVQHGGVTAPVVTDTGEDAEVVTVFKVTDDVRASPLVATVETVVIKDGVPVRRPRSRRATASPHPGSWRRARSGRR